MANADQALIEEKIKAALVEGRLPCPVALKMAQDLKIDPKVIREKADEIDVKISKCQLGCFG